MDRPQTLIPKEWQGPEARRLIAELQTHPGWRLVLAWLEAVEALAKAPVPMTPEVGPLWPFKRALADGKAEAFSDLRTMLAIASAIPGRMDGRGNIKPVDFDADGDDEP
jgi:hypothetical protein